MPSASPSSQQGSRAAVPGPGSKAAPPAMGLGDAMFGRDSGRNDDLSDIVDSIASLAMDTSDIPATASSSAPTRHKPAPHSTGSTPTENTGGKRSWRRKDRRSQANASFSSGQHMSAEERQEAELMEVSVYIYIYIYLFTSLPYFVFG